MPIIYHECQSTDTASIFLTSIQQIRLKSAEHCCKIYINYEQFSDDGNTSCKQYPISVVIWQVGVLSWIR